jgi:hypothetical protein
MATKKKHDEFREKQYSRNSEGLKQRRLKNDSRWKFNPNASYESEEDDVLEEEDWSYDQEFEERNYR